MVVVMADNSIEVGIVCKILGEVVVVQYYIFVSIGFVWCSLGSNDFVVSNNFYCYVIGIFELVLVYCVFVFQLFVCLIGNYYWGFSSFGFCSC